MIPSSLARCILLLFLVPSVLSAQIAGTHDLSFLHHIEGQVRSIAIQPNGQTVVGGWFYLPGAGEPLSLARLNPDGSLEAPATFNPGTGSQSTIQSVTIQDDGKILIAGAFVKIDGQFRNRIARLLPNGALESLSTFDPGPGPDQIVHCVTLQPDGKILIGGEFLTVNSQRRRGIARLLPDGSLDPSFNPASIFGGWVRTIALQSDGKILIGGDGLSFQGRLGFQAIGRLNPNGSLESAAAFDTTVLGSGRIHCLRLQPDGKILAGGEIPGLIRRLNPDGSPESSGTFHPDPGMGIRPHSLLLQANGQMILGGDMFFPPDATTSGCLARLNSDASLQTIEQFDHTVGLVLSSTQFIFSLALQQNGQLLLGGDFTVNFPEFPKDQRNIARIFNDPALQSLSVEGRSRVLWQCSGTSPEPSSVTFQLSTDDGSTWTPLGNGTRIQSGWELAGLTLPASGKVRARVRIDGSLLETVESFTSSPTSLESWRSTHFGTFSNAGPAANDADPDGDGLSNFMEFAFALDPSLPGATSLPQWQKTDTGFTLQFTAPASVSGVRYTAEQSVSPESGWTPIPNAGTPPLHSFTALADTTKLFLRLRSSYQ
jgi:uncharacterized delta-60 repeat protein